MKVGVSSYSFGRLLNANELTLVQLPAEAKKIGFEAIEFTGFPADGATPPLKLAAQLKKACAKQGLPIACYTVGADFLNGSGGNLDKEIERVKEQVRIAAALGAPCMRHDAGWGFPAERRGARSFLDALPRLAAGVRGVTEYAAGLGVRTTVENHGYFCQDSERVEKLICAVDHPNFGALIDIGNFLCVDEDPARAVGLLAQYAFHVHAKDFHVKSGMSWDPADGWFQSRGGNRLRGAIVGHGEVPVLQCLRLLKRAGYDGVCSLEFEGMEDPRTGIRLGCQNLHRMIAALG